MSPHSKNLENNGGLLNDGGKENLQQKETTLAKILKELYNSGIFADVHFSFGEGDQKKFLKAHKNVLASSSDVFEMLLYYPTPNAEISQGKVQEKICSIREMDVSHLDVDAFKIMLEFIYTKNLSGLNADNALEVLKAANEYNIAELASACKALQKNETTFNPLFNYLDAQEHGDKIYAQQCLDYIDRNADRLIKSKEFLYINENLLIEILEREQLVVKDEMSIWEAALRWADQKCRQNGIECSPENRRQMLGPALYQIRLSRIQHYDFDSIANSGVLHNDEVIRLYRYYDDLRNFCEVPVGASGEGQHQRYPLRFSTQNRHYAKIRERITFTIQQFSKFKHKIVSEKVHIGGLAWQIVAKKHLFCLDLYLRSNSETQGTKWSCDCTARLTIVSNNKEKENYTNESYTKTFTEKKNERSYNQLNFVKDLMVPENGWYNKEEDSLTVVADIVLENVKTVG